MKHIIRNLSALSFCIALLSGCAADSPFRSLFGKDVSNDYSKSDLPSLGSTNFEPIKISRVDNTGTLVGQKVIAFRNDLTKLQESIRQNNNELQKVRASVIDNAIDYHNTTAAMEAKLQVGTTPGNPVMYDMLQKTQNNIVVMDENANTLNNIYNQAVSDLSVVNNLQDYIRATYSVAGAIDEDHTQLRTLENETSQTAILINSLLSEVKSDYARQMDYRNTARHYLASLDRAIKVGNFGMANAPVAQPRVNYYQAPQAVQPVQPVQQQPLPPAVQQVSGKPLFVVKFNNRNVNYQDSLHRTIQTAQGKNPGFHYEVVAVTPPAANQEVKDLAQTQAGAMFEEIINTGVGPDKVDILSKTSESATGAEVQIFVK